MSRRPRLPSLSLKSYCRKLISSSAALFEATGFFLCLLCGGALTFLLGLGREREKQGHRGKQRDEDRRHREPASPARGRIGFLAGLGFFLQRFIQDGSALGSLASTCFGFLLRLPFHLGAAQKHCFSLPLFRFRLFLPFPETSLVPTVADDTGKNVVG